MRGFTIQNSIDLLEKNGGGGSPVAPTASDVSYDNTSSGLTADTVQEAIDELSAKEITASGVSYDNTDSGLTADTVQEAIDELNTAIGQINPLPFIYSKTERVVGKWIDDRDVYQLTMECTADASLGSAGWTAITWDVAPTDVDILLSAELNGGVVPNLNEQVRFIYTDGVIKGAAQSNTTLRDGVNVTFKYVKTAPVSNTRKRSSK